MKNISTSHITKNLTCFIVKKNHPQKPHHLQNPSTLYKKVPPISTTKRKLQHKPTIPTTKTPYAKTHLVPNICQSINTSPAFSPLFFYLTSKTSVSPDHTILSKKKQYITPSFTSPAHQIRHLNQVAAIQHCIT